MSHQKLNPIALGVAIGITMAISLFFLAMLAMYCNWGNEIITLTASFYKGYAATWNGSLFGALWGFVDGFIGGLLIGWIYNWVQ